jgi:hypothetical protein
MNFLFENAKRGWCFIILNSQNIIDNDVILSKAKNLLVGSSDVSICNFQFPISNIFGGIYARLLPLHNSHWNNGKRR